MDKSLKVCKDTHKKLTLLKIKWDMSTIDGVICKLIELAEV